MKKLIYKIFKHHLKQYFYLKLIIIISINLIINQKK